jgi:hypothetical protein
MSLSNEEISTGNIDLFEHVANPEDKLDFSVTWRLLDFVPLIEQTLLDHLIELLEEKNLFRNQVKGSLKRASQLVDQACTQAYMSMGFDRKQSSEQFDGNMQFALEMTEKMTSCMLEYMGRIESITNVSGFLTEEKRTNYILDNAVLLYKLVTLKPSLESSKYIVNIIEKFYNEYIRTKTKEETGEGTRN